MENLSRAEQMRQHIDQCNLSEKTVAQYCKDHGLGIGTYYYWLKKLNLKTVTASEKFIELSNVVGGCSMEVYFPSGVKLYIHSPIAASYLKELCFT